VSTSPFATFISGHDRSDVAGGIVCRPVRDYTDKVPELRALKRAYETLRVILP